MARMTHLLLGFLMLVASPGIAHAMDLERPEVRDFIDAHDAVFVVEQNESAQLRQLLINEGEIDPKKLVRVLHYDGTPITARFIAGKISAALDERKITPIRKVAS